MKVTLRGFIIGTEGSKDDQKEEKKRGMEDGGVKSKVESWL